MAQGDVFVWTGQDSAEFGDALNWYDATTRTAGSGVPGLTNEALVTTSGSIVGSGDVLELALTGTGSIGLAVDSFLQANLVYLGGAVFLQQAGGIFAENLIDIGDGSSATLAEEVPTTVTVSNGLEIEAAANEVNAGGIVVGQGGGSGTLVASSQAGSIGGTVLSYADGGSAALSVGVGGGSTGEVDVLSRSALAAFGKVSVGQGGTGTIAVTFLSRLNAGVDAAGGGVTIGSGGGTGVLSLSEVSNALLQGATVVGANGTGSVSVTGGSGLFVQSSTGTALQVGAVAGGTGSMVVSGVSSFANVTGGVDVGGGGVGSLTVEDNALMESSDGASATSPALTIGGGIGGSGTVSVLGQSDFVAMGAGIVVGLVGDGVLDITNAYVTVNTVPSASGFALDAGEALGSQGVVNVLGGGITDTGAAGMIVGDAGSGTMTIGGSPGQGGVVLTGDPNAAAGFSLGLDAGSDGTLSISGAASAMGVYGAVADGVSGLGRIDVDGGQLIITHGPLLDGLVLGGTGGAGAMSVEGVAQVYVLGHSVIGDEGSGVLSITGGSGFTGIAPSGTTRFANAGAGAAMVLGLSSTGIGAVLISDVSTYVPLTGGLVVGESGSGSLSVTNDAVLSVSGTFGQGGATIVLGDANESTGTLSISAHAQVIDNGAITVGYYGHGELDVSNATLTLNTLGYGALNICAGPLLGGTAPSGVVNVAGGLIEDVYGAGINVGESDSGTLAISQVGSNGGTVLTGSLAIGESFGTGLVSVDGSASGLGAVTSTSIGDGSLSLTNGGRFVTGHSLDTTGLYIAGRNVGGGGVSMAGGSVANVLGETQISVGNLSITGGSGFTGTVEGSAFAPDALSLQAISDAIVSDPGSYMNLTGALVIGDGDTHGFGASMVVENGGLVAVTAAGASDTGVSIGSSGGDLVVDGGGSRLVVTGQFAVGATADVGNGEMTISSGGTVTVTEVSGQTGPAAEIGATNGNVSNATGMVTVTGAGSDWTIGGALYVGVNDNAAAGLSVTDGGHVSAGAVVDSDLQSGLIFVHGTGSTLDATSLTLGGSTPGGTLNLGTGGLVHVSGGVGLNGTVKLFGGTLESSATVSLSAQSAINGYGEIGAHSILDLGAIAVGGGTMTCLGTITGTGELTLNNGVLVLGSSEAASVGVAFLSGGGSLVAQSSGDIAGTITGWAMGDFVDLQNDAATTESYANGTLSLFGDGSQLLGMLNFTGSLSTSNFTLTTLAGGGTEIGYHS